MLFHPGPDQDFIRRDNELREQRRKLSEQRADLIIKRTKNPPPASLDLIAYDIK